MRSFRIKNGDLVLDTSRRADHVVGKSKLIQDLTMWLTEPYGAGPTTPRFGSKLSAMIGEPDPHALALDVETEINRLLSLYQANQFEAIKSARDNGRLASFTVGEILNKIESVQAAVLADRVQVSATIQTASGANLTVPIAVSPEGVSA